MRCQMAYPIASALPSKPGGVMENQTANTSIAASGTSQRTKLLTVDWVGGVCSIAFIIWGYGTVCKQGYWIRV